MRGEMPIRASWVVVHCMVRAGEAAAAIAILIVMVEPVENGVPIPAVAEGLVGRVLLVLRGLPVMPIRSAAAREEAGKAAGPQEIQAGPVERLAGEAGEAAVTAGEVAQAVRGLEVKSGSGRSRRSDG